MNVIFYEDDAQLQKILHHTNQQCYIKIRYKGRVIVHSSWVGENSEKRIGSFIAIIKSLKANTLMCEYANGLPRIWALLFGLKIESHIFGLLNKSNLSIEAEYWGSLRKKLRAKLYAEEYYIYGEHNPTNDLVQDICKIYKSNVGIRKRRDLPKIFNAKVARTNWAVYVGQPWSEIGCLELDLLQGRLYDEMDKKFEKIYYCKHPRQKNLTIDSKVIINGWLELKEIIESKGPPEIAISISSSLIFELKEMGIRAINMSHRTECVTMPMSEKSALSNLSDLINNRKELESCK
jgi:hypothetical protein